LQLKIWCLLYKYWIENEWNGGESYIKTITMNHKYGRDAQYLTARGGNF
jgi:hypothetical protein